jgi:hypothetical protein
MTYEGNIAQFKLLNGEELLAEVVESSVETFVIKNALTMEPLDPEQWEDYETAPNKSFYVLRPFISYIDDLEKNVSLNPISVVCVTLPSEVVLEQYMGSVDQIQTELMAAMWEKEGQEDDYMHPDAVATTQKGNVVSIMTKKQLLTEESDSV